MIIMSLMYEGNIDYCLVLGIFVYIVFMSHENVILVKLAKYYSKDLDYLVKMDWFQVDFINKSYSK